MADLHQVPVCLTIAGSDSSGGAGIQADLRTFSRFSVYGMSAITAVTAQSTDKVHAVTPVPQDTLASQVRAAMDSADIAAVKIGMVHSNETLTTLASLLKTFSGPVVMDPVLAAGCGGKLNETLPRDELLAFISACVTVLTPNIPEAEYLLSTTIRNRQDMEAAAAALKAQCNVDVYLKGGHASEDRDCSLDILSADVGEYSLVAPPLKPPVSHGTGCTLSSALAASLALGYNLLDAAIAAKAFVWQSLNHCVCIGDGKAAMFPPESLDTTMVSMARL